MKKIYLSVVAGICVLLFACGSADQTPTAVHFFGGTFDQALQKAGAEHKMVFLDAHADWCGFCKKMKRTTYSDKQVGDLLNEKFISISIDMEKGEGIGLGQRYGVEAYPTLYILDAQGNLVKESKGYLTPSQLLDFVQ